MSAEQIIAELSNLSRPELEELDAHLHALLKGDGGASFKSWGEALLAVAGTAQGLPEDFAQNHDHYLRRAARR